MSSRRNRGRLARVVAIGAFTALFALSVSAQGGGVQLAEGSGVQPLFVLDSGAQWGATWYRPSRCAKALKADHMSPVEIYLDARMAPHTDSSLTTQADLLASDVAAALRKQLGGSDSARPEISDKIKWYSIPAELILVARPDGSMTWRGLSESGDAGAVDLLSTALDSVRRHGGGLMFWPEGYAADSIVLRLSLLPKLALGVPTLVPERSKRVGFLVFTMLRPQEKPALPKRDFHVRYPGENQLNQVNGYILTQFVVDTSGRAVMSTFKDLWPAENPRLSRTFEGYYAAFVRAVRKGVSEATFFPARVGSCVEPQIVQLPVAFVHDNDFHQATR